jgi:membrane fusion protein (multidrug efflux system)
MTKLPKPVTGTIIGMAALLIASGGTGSAHAQGKEAAQPPISVVIAPAERKEKRPSMVFTGRVEAINKVDLRARVEGYLEKRLFTEGDAVKKGDLLFQIEQGPYQAKLDAARANVARSEANAQNTAFQLRRGQELLRNNNISQATVDQRAAEDAMAQAEVLQQKAALQSAELEFGYTQLYAAVDGQMGRANYSVGNYVTSSSGTLAILVSRNPMYVTFPVTQRELLSVRKRAEGQKVDSSAIKVDLRLADGSVYGHSGALNFVDVQVSPQTDTVIVRATVPNPDQLLIDGQLVTAIAEIAAPEAAIFIPQQALQFDQTGYFVLVVDGENRVKVRRVQLGAGREGEMEIASGLEEGERVIVEGLQKVRPNQVVQAVESSSQTPTQ